MLERNTGDNRRDRAEGTREYRTRNSEGGRDYRRGNSEGTRDARRGSGEGGRDYRPRSGEGGRDYRQRNSEGSRDYRQRNSEGSREYRPNQRGGEGNREYRPRNTEGNRDYKPRDNQRSAYGRGGFGGMKDKDADYENEKRKFAPRESKPKEKQPEKAVLTNRFEKEKKAVQKKSEANRKGKPGSSKPQVRVKRTNNIDWTREYENDSYDDDDTYYDFL